MPGRTVQWRHGTEVIRARTQDAGEVVRAEKERLQVVFELIIRYLAPASAPGF